MLEENNLSLKKNSIYEEFSITNEFEDIKKLLKEIDKLEKKKRRGIRNIAILLLISTLLSLGLINTLVNAATTNPLLFTFFLMGDVFSMFKFMLALETIGENHFMIPFEVAGLQEQIDTKKYNIIYNKKNQEDMLKQVQSENEKIKENNETSYIKQSILDNPNIKRSIDSAIEEYIKNNQDILTYMNMSEIKSIAVSAALDQLTTEYLNTNTNNHFNEALYLEDRSKQYCKKI